MKLTMSVKFNLVIKDDVSAWLVVFSVFKHELTISNWAVHEKKRK